MLPRRKQAQQEKYQAMSGIMAVESASAEYKLAAAVVKQAIHDKDIAWFESNTCIGWLSFLVSSNEDMGVVRERAIETIKNG